MMSDRGTANKVDCETGPSIRVATASDQGVLRLALACAIDWRSDRAPDDPEHVIGASGHEYLLADWGRSGDAAVVAEVDKRAVGAAWYRFWDDTLHSYGYVDLSTPELGIGVHPAYRGRGIGAALLAALIKHAASRGVERLSLSVERENPALHLYQRMGFGPVGGTTQLGDAIVLSASTMVKEPKPQSAPIAGTPNANQVPITIRPATAADLPYLRDQLLMVQELHCAAYPNRYRPISPRDAESFLADRLRDERCYVRLATTANNTVVGYTVSELQERLESLFAHARTLLYLAQIVVLPEYRTRGSGRALIEDVLATARQHGIEQVELDVWEFAGNAHRFFAECGFQDVGYRMVCQTVGEPR